METFFEIPELRYDKDQLLNIYTQLSGQWAIYGNNPNDSLHTMYAEEVDFIIDQFNNDIIDNIKFFKTLANGSVSAHTDRRNIAINIPVYVNNDMYVTFYEKRDEEVIGAADLNVKDKTLLTSAKRYNPTVPIEKFVIKTATCITTNIPHSVRNNSSNDRIVLSISVKEQYDNFNIIKDMYLSKKLLKVQVDS